MARTTSLRQEPSAAVKFRITLEPSLHSYLKREARRRKLSMSKMVEQIIALELAHHHAKTSDLVQSS